MGRTLSRAEIRQMDWEYELTRGLGANLQGKVRWLGGLDVERGISEGAKLIEKMDALFREGWELLNGGHRPTAHAPTALHELMVFGTPFSRTSTITQGMIEDAGPGDGGHVRRATESGFNKSFLADATTCDGSNIEPVLTKDMCI